MVVIFKELIIIVRIPLAQLGAKYHAVGAGCLLRDKMLFCSLRGRIVPIPGIKLIGVIMVEYVLAWQPSQQVGSRPRPRPTFFPTRGITQPAQNVARLLSAPLESHKVSFAPR